MDPELEKQITDTVLSGIEVETIFNTEDDTLPYGYFKARGGNFPAEMVGKLVWMCNYDAEERITSVFLFAGGPKKEKKVDILPDMDAARMMRQNLVDDGWEKLKDPKITFSYAGDEKTEKDKLNRRDRRFLQKKLRKMNKRNPYEK